LGKPGDVGRALFDGTGGERKRAIGCLVNAFVVSIGVVEQLTFEHPLLRFQAQLDEKASVFLEHLKELVIRKVIKTAQVQTLEYRGQQLIVDLFDALNSDPMRLMKQNFRDLYLLASDEGQRIRVICDYIAGMTDEYATRMFERLFVPRHGQFSDRF
jgi:dGTPase